MKSGAFTGKLYAIEIIPPNSLHKDLLTDAVLLPPAFPGQHEFLPDVDEQY